MRFALVAAAVVIARSSARRTKLAHVGQDPGATKYSTPLDQINTSNVNRCSRRGRSTPATRPASSRARRSSSTARCILSAQNGVQRSIRPPARSSGNSNPTAARAAAWPIGRRRRSAGAHLLDGQAALIALDRQDRPLVPQVGQGGFVDMGTTMASPPSIYKDILITRRPRRSSARGTRAPAAALDLQPDRAARRSDNKTWEGTTRGRRRRHQHLGLPDGRRPSAASSTSRCRSPADDYVGVERPGDNLYGTSLVAVDIATGKRSGISSSCITTSGTTTSAPRRR